MENALAFYADEDNWGPDSFCIFQDVGTGIDYEEGESGELIPIPVPEPVQYQVRGEIARQALGDACEQAAKVKK